MIDGPDSPGVDGDERDAMALAFSGPVIIVGGTNGKGSTCALLEAMLRAAGYRVGLYTSPHLIHYNERVRIDGEEAADDVLVRGFEAVEAARGGPAERPICCRPLRGGPGHARPRRLAARQLMLGFRFH